MHILTTIATVIVIVVAVVAVIAGLIAWAMSGKDGMR
jgi:hypothetical protein